MLRTGYNAKIVHGKLRRIRRNGIGDNLFHFVCFFVIGNCRVKVYNKVYVILLVKVTFNFIHYIMCVQAVNRCVHFYMG